MRTLLRVWRGHDFRVAAALFCVAAVTGMVYVSTWGSTPHFYQELFGPAAMFACGRGFVNPAEEGCPELEAFLHPPMHTWAPPPVDALDCGALPKDLATGPLTPFQRRQMYLLAAAAAVWWLFGVAWSSLAPLYGLLYGASAAALYGLFRQGVNRALAAACTLALIFSPIQLNNLVRLRDYAKAPFLLGIVLVMAWLVRRGGTRGRVLSGGAAAGLLVGVGAGFRMDTLICVPAFAVLLALFVEGAPFRRPFSRAAAAVLCAGLAALLVLPFLLGLEAGGSYHHFVLGINDLYDAKLGVGGAPYQVGHRYLDREAMATLQAFSEQVHGETRQYAFETAAYQEIGRAYFWRVVATFPADLLVRAYAAVLRGVDELHANLASPAPRGVENVFVRDLFFLRAAALYWPLRFARYAVAAGLLLLAARRLRWGFGALFLLLFFCGYAAIQFASRHYFHLEFVSLWAAAFVAYAAALGVWALRRHDARRYWLRRTLRRAVFRAPPALRRAAVFGVCAALLLTVPLWTLRAYQSHRVHGLLAGYASAATEDLQTARQPLDDGKVLVAGAGLPGESVRGWDRPRFEHAFLVAEFDTGAGPVPVTARYRGSIFDVDFTWQITLAQTDAGPTRLFFPAYWARWSGPGEHWTCFAGLELAEADAARLAGLRRAVAPERLDLLLTAVLRPDWESARLYQRIIR